MARVYHIIVLEVLMHDDFVLKFLHHLGRNRTFVVVAEHFLQVRVAKNVSARGCVPVGIIMAELSVDLVLHWWHLQQNADSLHHQLDNVWRLRHTL